MRHPSYSNESGNILFMVLIAIALLGLLSAAVLSGNNSEGANIDDEQLRLRVGTVQRQVGEIERAVRFIMQDGKSESDLRFAHPDANSDYGDLSADTDRSDQIFHSDGGAAEYRAPPADILASSGQKWEFYGGTAVPLAGSNNPELVAVLPNVTLQFCREVNEVNGQSSQQPNDDGAGAGTSTNAGGCINGGSAVRFGNGVTFYNGSGMTANTMDQSSFDKLPPLQACVQCADNSYHFYHVLMVR